MKPTPEPRDLVCADGVGGAKSGAARGLWRGGAASRRCKFRPTVPAPSMSLRIAILALVCFLPLVAGAQSAPRSEEITIATTRDSAAPRAQDVFLAATVTVPQGAGPFPAVVLVSRGGRHDRDGNEPGAWTPRVRAPYDALAQSLADAGVLVLRYDERGVGESTSKSGYSSPNSPQTLDLEAEDVEAAVKALAARTDVRWAGIIGHGEGADLALRVAARQPAVGGVAMVSLQAGTGIDATVGGERRAMEALGLSGAVQDSVATALRAALEMAAGAVGDDGYIPTETYDGVLEALQRVGRALPLDLPEEARLVSLTAQTLPATLRMWLVSPSGIASLSTDPLFDVRALAVPALAVFSEQSTAAPPEAYAAPMRAALDASASPAHETHVLDFTDALRASGDEPPDPASDAGAEIDPGLARLLADWVCRAAAE